MGEQHVDQDVIERIGDRVAENLSPEQFDTYTQQLVELRDQQDREVYELRLYHCHQRLQLLHRFNASDALIATFWRRHMERVTRRFQTRRRGGTNSTVNL